MTRGERRLELRMYNAYNPFLYGICYLDTSFQFGANCYTRILLHPVYVRFESADMQMKTSLGLPLICQVLLLLLPPSVSSSIPTSNSQWPMSTTPGCVEMTCVFMTIDCKGLRLPSKVILPAHRQDWLCLLCRLFNSRYIKGQIRTYPEVCLIKDNL